MNCRNWFGILILVFANTVYAQKVEKEYPFTEIIQNQYGGPQKPQLHIVKELESMKQFYAFINKTRKPGFALPKINFDKETVIILCLGEKRTGGYGIKVNNIIESEEEIQVFIKEIKPSGDMVATVITRPFYIAKIPITSKEIKFKLIVN